MTDQKFQAVIWAAISALGMLCLTLLAIVRRDMPIATAMTAISVLGVRGVGLMTHALGIDQGDVRVAVEKELGS